MFVECNTHNSQCKCKTSRPTATCSGRMKIVNTQLWQVIEFFVLNMKMNMKIRLLNFSCWIWRWIWRFSVKKYLDYKNILPSQEVETEISTEKLTFHPFILSIQMLTFQFLIDWHTLLKNIHIYCFERILKKSICNFTWRRH